MNSKKLTKVVSLLIAASTVLISLPIIAKACPTKISISKNQGNQTGTIVEIAASNPNLKTLVTAVQAAGLLETLSGDSQFTVFAPTDEAFAQLPKGTLEKLRA